MIKSSSYLYLIIVQLEVKCGNNLILDSHKFGFKLYSNQISLPWLRSSNQPCLHHLAKLHLQPPTISRYVCSQMLLPACISLPLSSFFSQPFFVLHKAAPAASISSLTSRARRRIDVSQPSSPNPKSAKRSRHEDDDDDKGDTELYGQLRLEAFHRTWSKIQSTINVCLSSPTIHSTLFPNMCKL